MQTGVAMKMNFDSSETEPKHLRVGVNSAMVETATLFTILMNKGIFTQEEFDIELTRQMNLEADKYEKEIQAHYPNTKITLH